MRTILITTLAIAGLPALSYGQSDLQKIGRFLQGIQDMQQQQQPPNNQNGGNYQPRNAPYYEGNPNSSGNQNRGDFGRTDFFGPQNGGGQPGRIIYPNGQNQNNYHPQQTYPGNTRIVYPQGTNPSYNNGRVIYSDPPRAPQRTYSGLPIVVRCSPAAIGTCSYELVAGGKAFPYQIKAGQTQNLKETADWAIRYRPTPSSPYKTYRLRGGKTYEMRKNGNNWQF